MALRTNELDLGRGLVVYNVQLDSIRASRLLAKLGKMFGPTFVQLAMSLAAGQTVVTMNVLEIVPVLAQAFGEIEDPEKHDKLLLAIFVSTEALVDGRKINLLAIDKIMRAFEGRLLDMYRAAWFVLKENYGDFLPAGSSPESSEPALPPKSETSA
jgi:hypothetical protein